MTDTSQFRLKPLEGLVLSLMARDYEVPEIEEELKISHHYVYILIRNLKQQFWIKSNAGLVCQAIAAGVLKADGTLIDIAAISSRRGTKKQLNLVTPANH